MFDVGWGGVSREGVALSQTEGEMACYLTVLKPSNPRPHLAHISSLTHISLGNGCHVDTSETELGCRCPASVALPLVTPPGVHHCDLGSEGNVVGCALGLSSRFWLIQNIMSPESTPTYRILPHGTVAGDCPYCSRQKESN